MWSLGLTVILLLSVVAPSAAAPVAPLADAAEKQDLARVRALLDQGSDINAAQVDGTTALHWVAYQDDFETAKLLIEAGADVKAANRYGVTPLTPALTNGNVPLVELLLANGADANTALEGGETALMTAARAGSLRAVKALLRHGADVNAQESQRQTALMWAAAEGHVQVVEALLEAGADSSVRLKSGFTAFLFAVREGRLDVVRLLLAAGADPNETIETVFLKKRLSREGPAYPADGMSALLLAASNQHYEVGAYLLVSGADPNANLPGYTVLHKMASVRKPGVGDNPPSPEGSGAMTSIEFVQKLVTHDADLDARMSEKVNLGNTRLNKLGATPFFLAAHAADAELMRVLAALGADTEVLNVDGSTPLMAAAGLGTRSPGEDAGTEPEVLEAVQTALELDANINAVDCNGETAMHGAAYKNLPKVVELLAENGANIEIWDVRNVWGWTPLDIAEGYRFGNFKPSPVTVAALHKVMLAAGVNPLKNRGTAKTQQIY